MAAFEYTALDANGKTKKGILEGDSLRHVRQLMRDIGLTPMNVELTTSVEKEGQQGFVARAFGKLKPMEMVLFTRQLATLVSAGLPLEEAMSAVAQQTSRKRARKIFMAVRTRVVEGQTLTRAMSEHPGTFNELYRSTVGAGEQSGQLDNVLENLADYLEKQHESRRNVQSALYYPILLFIVAVIIVGGLMTYVVPTIVEVFSSTGEALPLVTVILITVSEFLRDWAWAVLIGLLLFLLLIRYSLSINAIRMAWHRVKLRLPTFGWFARSMNAARYANTLAILGSSGVPLVDGMNIASNVVNNLWIRRLLEQAYIHVSEGTSLNRALDTTKQFPPIFIHMIASGEMSGSLDKMLFKSAEYQQQELQRIIDTLVELFRPTMLLVMAGMVFFIMIAVLLPILSMTQLAI